MASTHSKQAQLSPGVWDLLYNQLIHPPSPVDNSLGANFKPTPSIWDSELALPIVKHLNVLSFKNVSPSVSDFWPSFLWLPWCVYVWFGLVLVPLFLSWFSCFMGHCIRRVILRGSQSLTRSLIRYVALWGPKNNPGCPKCAIYYL